MQFADGDGTGNNADSDYDDSDGIPDANDSCQLAVNPSQTDGNANEMPDSCDIANGASDEDEDARPDACEHAYDDWNLDGVIGAKEFALLLSGCGAAAPTFGDLTGDGVVNAEDLSLLLTHWGAVPY